MSISSSKNILLCLDVLNIGGVETFVINQSLALNKKGYNVFIASRNGIYTEMLTSQGITCLEFNFVDRSYYDYDDILKFVDIIKKYNINEVHINQFSSMQVVFPACILTNTPYVVYLHMGASLIDDEKFNAYNYFEKSFYTYKENFNILFKCAKKIIAVTPKIKEYTAKRYNFSLDKCIVRYNGIDFESYLSNKKVTEIKNVLIISRLNEEKKTSIFNAIDLFVKLNEKIKDLHLNIAGDGSLMEEIVSYIEEKNIKDNTTFHGSVNNVKDLMDENDLVIGVGRCILEALSMKLIIV